MRSGSAHHSSHLEEILRLDPERDQPAIIESKPKPELSLNCSRDKLAVKARP